MITTRSFSERRKAGRYLPLEQNHYDLYINGKKIDTQKMIDIGPDGLKLFSSKFNAFKEDTVYEVEFKSGTHSHFKTTATVCWRVNLRFPLNTCLIGFKIQDFDHDAAKFWVANAYRNGFVMTKESNLSRFKVFHNLVFKLD